MLYPLKFEPVYKNYIWGGKNLERFHRKLPSGAVIAESWDLSCHPEGVSIVSEGKLKGLSLPELLMVYKHNLIGNNFTEAYIKSFPLLVKLIDANKDLSIQVHPDDEYAVVYENGEHGKNEMWYVMDAKPGSKLIYGLKPEITKEAFTAAIKNGNIGDCLRYVEVFPGDIINIPSGVIHAIGEGIIIAEIQQNSNITYRVYDYDRVDNMGNKRPLHVEQALDVIKFGASGIKNKSAGLKVKINDGFSVTYAVANRFFAAEIHELNGIAFDETDGSKFFVYIVLEGSGQIKYENGETKIKAGETLLIPAYLGNYILEGKYKALKAYIPDLKNDVVIKLKTAGYSKDSIYSILASNA